MGLILSRKIGESIVITAGGKTIRITQGTTRGGISRLHIEAAKDVEIDREEIYFKKITERGNSDAKK